MSKEELERFEGSMQVLFGEDPTGVGLINLGSLKNIVNLAKWAYEAQGVFKDIKRSGGVPGSYAKMALDSFPKRVDPWNDYNAKN